MKKAFSLFVIALMVAFNATAAFAAPPPPEGHAMGFAGYVDCDDQAVIDATLHGIVGGTGNGEFQPLRPVTHAEWAVMLYNALCPNKAEAEAPESASWWETAAVWLNQDVLFSVTGEHFHEAGSPLCEEVCDKFAWPIIYPHQPASLNWMVRTLASAIYPRGGFAINGEGVSAHGEGVTRLEAVRLLMEIYEQSSSMPLVPEGFPVFTIN